MSHGSTADAAEPNLVPLLDVVLQLIMFFIISANFVMEDLNENIKLPEAAAAKSLDARSSSLLFVNVNTQGQVLVTNDTPRQGGEIGLWFDQMYRIEERRANAGKVETVIIIRASRDARFKDVHEVMMAAKKAGFSSIQLRAIIES